MPVFFGVTSELLCATETWWWHFWHTTLSNLSQRPQSQRTFFLQSRYADMQVVPIVYHLLPFVMHKIIPWSYNRTYNLLPKPLFYAVISIFNFQSAIMNPCHHHHLSIRILETSLPSHHPWEWHILFPFLLVNRQCLVFCDNLDFILNPQSSLGIGNTDHNSIPFVFDRSRMLPGVLHQFTKSKRIAWTFKKQLNVFHGIQLLMKGALTTHTSHLCFRHRSKMLSPCMAHSNGRRRALWIT